LAAATSAPTLAICRSCRTTSTRCCVTRTDLCPPREESRTLKPEAVPAQYKLGTPKSP
jgi:hypothetical protein